MKKVYLLPNLLTAFSLACGLFIIFKVSLATGCASKQLLFSVSILLLLAGLADVLDGAVARLMNAESLFGMFFDSLADAVTFGVAPTVLFLKTLSLNREDELWFFATAAAMVFSICGVLRLVRYNVHGMQKQECEEVIGKKNFTGLPIPAGAMGLCSLCYFMQMNLVTKVWGVTPDFRFAILVLGALFLGYLMVSRWAFPSVKFLRFRLSSFRFVFFVVVVAVCLFYGVFYFFSYTFALISWGYILISLLLSLVKKCVGSRIKTLEDFEPGSDELD